MNFFDRRNFLRYASLGIFATLFTRKAEATTFLMKKFLALPPKEIPFITPNEHFYVVNFGKQPQIDTADWALEITGKVERPLRLTYPELLARPAVEKMVTLECIDNEVAGELISNAVWKGVSLKSLIEEAKPFPGVEDVAMWGADAYSDSISFDRAMNYDVFLAYQMNGATLPKEHGYPLRAVVPGLYGIKNVKWLTKIELLTEDYKGYWQQKGWTDVATIKVTSRIDAPGAYNTVKAGYTFRGIAFTGGYGIRAVELSFDGGTSWVPAALEPPPSMYSWVFWKYEWKDPKPGSYQVLSKATDKLGRTQTAFVARAFPDGTSGLHSVVTFVD
ncbi:MAG: oxidoreductase [Candidatus Manganitrophaceae bacterium]|nr:MAG: oxidoreductase [Candidatus Manganitrophaceae bacterium]